jgi:hypothetical protein
MSAENIYEPDNHTRIAQPPPKRYEQAILVRSRRNGAKTPSRNTCAADASNARYFHTSIPK